HMKADIRDFDFWFKSSLDKYSDPCKKSWEYYHTHHLYACAQCGESPNNILIDSLWLELGYEPLFYQFGLHGPSMNAPIAALRDIWTDRVAGSFVVSRLEWFREQTGAAWEFLLLEVNHDGIMVDMEADPMWILLDEQNALSKLPVFCRSLPDPRRVKISFHKKLIPPGLKPQASLVFLKRISLGYLLDVADVIYGQRHLFAVHAASPVYLFFELNTP
ncbi:hypothetical protein FRC12_022605, partial [Ceratobasidium sp. 428]